MNNNSQNPKIISFSQYLAGLGISKVSYKNYKSDTSHFTSWLILRLRSFGVVAASLEACFPYLNSKVAYEYKNYLVQNKIGGKTINRRLSTMRHLSRYLRQNLILSQDFMDNIINESAGITVTKEKVFKIKATSPFFGKTQLPAGTTKIMVELDKPLSNVSQINIWLTDTSR